MKQIISNAYSTFVILLLVCFPLGLSADNYLYKQLSTDEGFPASVQAVYTQTNGYVWVGSKSGLGRFDGYELKKYTYVPEDEHALPGQEIFQITADGKRHVLVLTNRGAVVYNPERDNFNRLTDEEGNTIVATAACHTPKDEVILFSHLKVFRWNAEKCKAEKITDLKTPSSYTIKRIIPWNENTLLCVSQWNGISLLSLNGGTFSGTLFKNEKEINGVLIDSRKRVWTSTYNKGITCYDMNGNLLANYRASNGTLSHDIVLCMAEYKNSIWVGTDGGGICVIHPDDRTVTELKHTAGNRNSLPVNTLQTIFPDEANTCVWVGSVKGGLIHIRKSNIQSYTESPLKSVSGLSERAVLSFCRDSESNDIWIGTDGGGINRFNPKQGTFTHYPSTLGEKVTSICPYAPHQLLVALFGNGLYLFDTAQGTLKKESGENAEVMEFMQYGRKSVNLYREGPNSILVLTDAVYRYDLSSKRLTRISDDKTSLQGQTVALGEFASEVYLYDLQNVYAVTKNAGQIRLIHSFPKDEAILCAGVSRKGLLWVATPKGLFCFDMAKRTEAVKAQIDERLLQNLSALVCDEQERVWLGTNEGLFVWLPAEQRLISFGESDGALPNEYLKKAVLCGAGGNVVLGGINGITCIDGSLSFDRTGVIPVLSLTDVLCNNSSILSRMKGGEVRLMNDVRTVTVRVMAHENNLFRNRNYRWRIEGDNSQVYETATPELTLRSLVPGKYHILVSCNTQEGGWTDMQSVVTVIVPPAWYQTWWFTLLWVVAAAGLILFFIRTTLRRKEEKMQLELKEHKQKVYEEKVRFLININHELRTPLTLIHAPLAQIVQGLPEHDKLYATLRNVIKQSNRMKNLLNMVLSLRKMEMGESKLHLEMRPLNDWIRDVAADFNTMNDTRGITIRYDLSDEISQVAFDDEKHTIIFTNLLVNAFKHSPDGSEITIRSEKTPDGKQVRIAICDQGSGLTDIDPAKLFTRFYQGNNEKTGTGIGLSYAKILVEQHGGTIGAQNNADRGACFYYTLPLDREAGEVVCSPQEYLNSLMGADDGNEAERMPETGSRIDTTQYSMLFVDDNEEIRELVRTAFEGRFKNLYTAADGKEAMVMIMAKLPDVVVSDIMMPKMNGYELCYSIKENVNINHIQVILLTARTDEQSHADGYRTGADAYLEKPFELSTLMETIKSRLLLREKMKERYSLTRIEQPEQNEAPIASADDTFLFKLNKCIIDNLASDKLNINFISQEVGVSRATLYNKLKALYDMGANEYITKIRMEKAMTLIAQGQKNFTEIAEETGFSTSRYFSTAFKQFMGMTPTQYREQLQQGGGKSAAGGDVSNPS